MLRKPQDSWLNDEGPAFPRMQNAIQSKQNLSVSVDTPCQSLAILAEILYTLIIKLIDPMQYELFYKTVGCMGSFVVCKTLLL